MSGAMSPIDYLMVCALLPVLLLTAFFDLKEMRIPNILSVVGLTLFALFLPFLGGEEGVFRILVGLTVLGVCFGMFTAGALGGGDAKILPVTMLFVPSDQMIGFSMAFSASMVLGMTGIWCARQKFSHMGASWLSMKPGAAFPMGISIAASLPLLLVVSVLSD